MSRKTVSGIVLALLLLGMFPVYAGIPDEPHDADAMWIEPSTISLSTENPEHTIGYKFNVTVWINLSVFCSGWQYKMLYNKEHLNATGCGYTYIDKSQFFQGIITFPAAPIFGSYNATHDFVMHGEAWMFGPMRNPGYGGLGWVEFNVTAVPPKGATLSSMIDISTCAETYALDSTGEEIPLATVGDCLYTFTHPPPWFEVKPNEYVADKLETFDVEIWLNKITGRRMVGYRLSLLYNATLLEVLNVTEGSFLKDPRWNKYGTLFFSRVETDMWYGPRVLATDGLMPNATGHFTHFPEGSGSLLTITFQGIHQDLLRENECTLGLMDAKMVNGSGYFIPTTSPINGSYKILPPKRDVAVCSVAPSAVEVYVGQVVNITVVVKNEGTIAENFTVKYKYELEDVEHVIGTAAVSDLAPYSNATLALNWTTTDVTIHTVKAEISPLPGETDMADNNMTSPTTVKVKVVGDVDGDDGVDIADIVQAALAFGSCPGHPSWNPQADIDNDGKVDIKDITMIALHFGETI